MNGTRFNLGDAFEIGLTESPEDFYEVRRRAAWLAAQAKRQKLKVLWLSRHEMTAEQAADLAKHLHREVANLEIVPRNVTWHATADGAADRRRNKAEWDVLIAETPYIAGVFPPVAIEAIRRGRPRRVRLYSPVSRQAPELRQAEGAIPFVHVRWAEV